MGYDCGDSYWTKWNFHLVQKPSQRLYPIHCERKWKYSFLSDMWSVNRPHAAPRLPPTPFSGARYLQYEFVAHYDKITKFISVHYICETYPKAWRYRQKMQANTVGTYLGGGVKSRRCMRVSCTSRQWLLYHDAWGTPTVALAGVCTVSILSKCFTNLFHVVKPVSMFHVVYTFWVTQ